MTRPFYAKATFFPVTDQKSAFTSLLVGISHAVLVVQAEVAQSLMLSFNYRFHYAASLQPVE